jgi:hypothetical protein
MMGENLGAALVPVDESGADYSRQPLNCNLTLPADGRQIDLFTGDLAGLPWAG